MCIGIVLNYHVKGIDKYIGGHFVTSSMITDDNVLNAKGHAFIHKIKELMKDNNWDESKLKMEIIYDPENYELGGKQKRTTDSVKEIFISNFNKISEEHITFRPINKDKYETKLVHNLSMKCWKCKGGHSSTGCNIGGEKNEK